MSTAVNLYNFILTSDISLLTARVSFVVGRFVGVFF